MQNTQASVYAFTKLRELKQMLAAFAPVSN